MLFSPAPLLAAIALPLLAGFLHAQEAAGDPARPRDHKPRPDFAKVASVSDVGGALHAVAAGWRATFEDEGSVTFVPALGREAPAAASWRMRLADVRRGGARWVDTSGAVPRTSHDRKCATRHWPRVDERFVAVERGPDLPALKERSFCVRLTVDDDTDIAALFAKARRMQPGRLVIGELHRDEMRHLFALLAEMPSVGGLATLRAEILRQLKSPE